MSTLLFISKDLLKDFLTNSTTITNWSITLIGASFLSIISTSYYKPEKGKLIYLLLFPAWGFLALSAHKSVELNDIYTSIDFINPLAPDFSEQLKIPGKMINDHYASQVEYFYWGVGILIIWLIAVVLFWIFEKPKSKESII